MASLVRLTSVVFLTVVCFLPFSTSFAALSSKALSPYVDGLDALNDGRWSDAPQPSHARSISPATIRTSPSPVESPTPWRKIFRARSRIWTAPNVGYARARTGTLDLRGRSHERHHRR